MAHPARQAGVRQLRGGVQEKLIGLLVAAVRRMRKADEPRPGIPPVAGLCRAGWPDVPGEVAQRAPHAGARRRSMPAAARTTPLAPPTRATLLRLMPPFFGADTAPRLNEQMNKLTHLIIISGIDIASDKH